ncbi:unnamed protein product [Caenorhabditis auriculariae]|uniref:Sterol regulatory element-binding protein cleavage-activating protein n=1 Tax=Caenorhabditis auriculariae TaxID=2777116 RepID=A0A8S1HRV1_9PELO|nr:unnamed protein product [Caenorhabditis auriculariae]
MSVPREKRFRWLTVKERVAHAYHDYGRLCAAHPFACLTMSIITMAMLSYPTLTRLQLPVNRPLDVFWSENIYDKGGSTPPWLSSPPAAFLQQIIVRATVEPWISANMTSEKAVRGSLSTAFRIREAVLSEPGLDESCLHFSSPASPSFFMPSGGCLVISPASFWLNNPQKLMEDEDVLRTIFATNCNPSFCIRDVLLGAPTQQTGIKKRFETNRKRTIEYALTVFFARFNPKLLKSLRENLGNSFELVKSAGKDENVFVHLYYWPLKKFSDYTPLIATYMLFMVYLYFSARKFEMVASRWGLAFAAAFTVAATLVMTTGICAHLDLSTTLWGAELYPYIALILGLENILCVTRSVVYTPPSLDVSSRIAHGLSQEGYKITKYFVLEQFSLLCGYLTGVGDIQEFCCFSSICLIVDFYMQLFFYAPCLTFDLQRLGLEEKRRFAEMLFSAEIPRLKNYAPVSCPMRKIWPTLFAMKKIQKRRLSDSQIEERELIPAGRTRREYKRSCSTTGHPEFESTELKSVSDDSKSNRLRFLYFITRTRIIQRTIMVVFAVWVFWLAFIVRSWQYQPTSLENETTTDALALHRQLHRANLQFLDWQKRTYKWWPMLADNYNITLPSRYLTFLPPIVLKAQVSPTDQLMERIKPVHSKIDEKSSETPVLRSKIDWLEMRLTMYLAAFWILLLFTVGMFFAYVCFRDRWKFGAGRVQEATVSNKHQEGGNANNKSFVESLPIVFSGHRFPIETVGIDKRSSSKIFISCCQEGRVFVWNGSTGELVKRLSRLRVVPDAQAEPPTPPRVWTLALQNEIAILGCADGSVEIASIDRNKLIGVFVQSPVGITHVEMFENRVILARLDGSIEFLDVSYEDSQPLRVKKINVIRTVRAHQKPVCRMITYNAQLITSSFDRTIKIFDLKTTELVNVLLAHNSGVLDLAVDTDENVLFSSCEDGVVCWWDLVTGKLIRSIDNNYAGTCQIALTSSYLLGFYGNAQLYLWSRPNGQLASRIAEATNSGFGDESMSGCGIVALDENIAATISGTNVTFWDIAHRAILRQVDIGCTIGSIRKLDEKSVLCLASNTIIMSDTTYPFSEFLRQHKDQLNASGVPPELWNGLYKKLLKEIFDAGDHFQVLCEMGDDGRKQCKVYALDEMHNVDEDNIFLIDHMWTFRAHEAREDLENRPPGLLQRIRNLWTVEKDDGTDGEESAEELVCRGDDGSTRPKGEGSDDGSRPGTPGAEKPSPNDVDDALKMVWKYAQTYSIRFEGDREAQPTWYLMDEFGISIDHSLTPNARVVPFFCVPAGFSYSVLFLTAPVKENEEITRNFAEGALLKSHPDWADYLQLPWVEKDFSAESDKHPKPSDEYFLSGRTPDEVPTAEQQATAVSAISASLPTVKQRSVRIYCPESQMQLPSQLKRKFEKVDSPLKADVVWTSDHYHDYAKFADENPCGLVNQFPYESTLTVKDLLASVAMNEYDTKKIDWYPLTYNLNTELPQFVAHFQKRQKSGQSNIWIIKPWNLARGMDIHVTDDIGKIVRLVESGPKIACEYISRPLLFPRPDIKKNVKFDLRFILFVRQLRPVIAFTYNKLWIRFSLKEFNLSQLDCTRTHTTVFNYSGNGDQVFNMHCEEFIQTMETAYPNLKWPTVEQKVQKMFREMLELVSKNDPPKGVAPNAQSRAMYGCDVMLESDDNGEVHPKLLECNFMPDCNRACQYYPDFADTAFNTLFFDEIDPSKVTAI